MNTILKVFFLSFPFLNVFKDVDFFSFSFSFLGGVTVDLLARLSVSLSLALFVRSSVLVKFCK